LNENNDEIETTKKKEPKQKSKLEIMIEGAVKNQYYKILIGKQKTFLWDRLFFAARMNYQFCSDDKFITMVSRMYKKNKKLWSSRSDRINNSKDLIEIQKEFPEVEVFFLAKFLMAHDKFSLKRRTDVKLLHNLIKIFNNQKLYDEKYDL